MRLHIKDIKKGDVFWEKTKRFVALEDSYTEVGAIVMFGSMRDQYGVKGISDDGVVVSFLVTDGAEVYGPTLYTENVYLSARDIDSSCQSYERNAKYLSDCKS